MPFHLHPSIHKKEATIGMRLGLTPFSMKDSIPKVLSNMGKAFDQSIIVAMTATLSSFDPSISDKTLSKWEYTYVA